MSVLLYISSVVVLFAAAGVKTVSGQTVNMSEHVKDEERLH